MAKIQDLCFKLPQNQDLCDLEKDLVQQFMALSSAEEAYKKQKSRINWLALGDKNTRFFHQKMNSHRVRNTILSLITDQGVRLENPADIEQEILGFYQKHLGTASTQRVDAANALTGVIQKTVLMEFRAGLYSDVSESEIWNALRSINRDKAPGPDGFNSAFFHDNWPVVKNDFVAAVQYFFVHGTMPRGWNATAITLIPKVAAPSSIKEYRPIACCNTIYKCITKVLAKRLQKVLSSVIGPS